MLPLKLSVYLVHFWCAFYRIAAVKAYRACYYALMRNRSTPRSSRRDGGREANSSRSSRSRNQGARASKARTGSARPFSRGSERHHGRAQQANEGAARTGRPTQSRRNQGLGSSWAASRAENSSWPFAAAMPAVGIAAVVVLAVILVMAVKSCSAPVDTSEEEQVAEEPAAPIAANYTPSLESIDGVSDPGTAVQGASLCQRRFRLRTTAFRRRRQGSAKRRFVHHRRRQNGGVRLLRHGNGQGLRLQP